MKKGNLILAGKPHVSRLIGGRYWERPVFPGNAHIVYGKVMLSRLIPLTWKFTPMFENGNSYEVTAEAAKQLFIGNVGELQYAQEVCHNTGPDYHSSAGPGDVIVILPLVGANFELAFGDPSGTRRYLENNHVTVVYIGKSLPNDLAHVLRGVDWKAFSIHPATSFADMVEANGDLEVSIFDAIKLGLCTPGVEAFQQKYFPGRSHTTLRELAVHITETRFGSYVDKLVRHKIGWGPDQGMDFGKQIEGLARVLRVDAHAERKGHVNRHADRDFRR